MIPRSYNALILCTGNSARSILAEAILNRLGKGRIRAYSAGSDPKGQVHPLALAVLREHDYDVSEFRSKSWDEFAGAGAPALDFVFTVCDNAAAESCPIWPGQPISAHWGLPDPAAFQGSQADALAQFRRTYDELRSRIARFTDLPIDTLDRMSLQKRLDEIGQTQAASDGDQKK